MKVVHELELLKPAEPFTHDDDLPIFSVTAADIFYQDEQHLESLLNANEEKPLTLVGRLQPMDNDKRHLLLQNGTDLATIRVPTVQRFAYGQYDDGKPVLWALGRAGWYEIQPSRRYRVIFKGMLEAVNALYFANDYYTMAKTKKRRASIDLLFDKYAEQPEHHCDGREEAAALYRQYGRFILDAMKKALKPNNQASALQDYLDVIERPQQSQEGVETPVEDESQAEDPAIEPAGVAMQGISTLRPRSSKRSTKGILRLGDRAVGENVDARVSPSPSPLKRARIVARALRAVKRAKLAGDEPDSASFIEDNDESESKTELLLPFLEPGGTARRNDPILSIVSELLPSYEAQGPGDVWTCPFDGCSHKVYGASTESSQRLIREHYHTHAVQSQAQLDLIYKEKRPYLPVSNLIKKIREMATQRKHASPPDSLSGDGFVKAKAKPIERVW